MCLCVRVVCVSIASDFPHANGLSHFSNALATLNMQNTIKISGPISKFNVRKLYAFVQVLFVGCVAWVVQLRHNTNEQPFRLIFQKNVDKLCTTRWIQLHTKYTQQWTDEHSFQIHVGGFGISAMANTEQLP